jgi:hypothetical protein
MLEQIDQLRSPALPEQYYVFCRSRKVWQSGKRRHIGGSGRKQVFVQQRTQRNRSDAGCGLSEELASRDLLLVMEKWVHGLDH